MKADILIIIGSESKFRLISNAFTNTNVVYFSNNQINSKFESSVRFADLVRSYYPASVNIIMFGRASKEGEIAELAKIIDHSQVREMSHVKGIFAPSFYGAEILNDKASTIDAFKKLEILIPESISYVESDNIPSDIFPCVLKPRTSTGGAGIKFISSYNDLLLKGEKGYVLSKYYEGPELSYAICKFNNQIDRLPVSVRSKSNNNLLHPDDKLKVTGYFDVPTLPYEGLEKLAKEYFIEGPLYYEGIWDKNERVIRFLEGGTRFSGSTEIRLKTMGYSDLGKYIFDKLNGYNREETSFNPCLQFPLYNLSLDQIANLKEAPVFNFETHDLSQIRGDVDKRFRTTLRITFSSNKELYTKLQQISKLLNKSSIIDEISSELEELRGYFPILMSAKV
jgi:hypothetical protein